MDTLTIGEELEIEGSEMNMDLPIEAPPPSKTYSTSSTQTAPLQDFFPSSNSRLMMKGFIFTLA